MYVRLGEGVKRGQGEGVVMVVEVGVGVGVGVGVVVYRRGGRSEWTRERSRVGSWERGAGWAAGIWDARTRDGKMVDGTMAMACETRAVLCCDCPK